MIATQTQTQNKLIDRTASKIAGAELAASGIGDILAGYYLCHVLHVMASTGMAQRLLLSREPLSEEQLVRGHDPEIGRAMLRFLVIRGVLQKTEGAFTPTVRGRLLFGEVARGLIGYNVEAYGPVLGKMEALLRKEAEYGKDVSRDFRALGEHCEVLARAFVTPLLLEALLEARVERVLDLGCGNAALLIDACTMVPGITGVGLDIAPDVIELARLKAEKAGVADRLELVCGDAFAPKKWPKSCESAKAWVMVGALHEHFRAGEDAVVKLLDEYAAQMRANRARLFILVEPELHYDERDANFFLCHVLTRQGMPRDRAGWSNVIERTNFEIRKIKQIPGLPFSFVQYELAPKGM